MNNPPCPISVTLVQRQDNLIFSGLHPGQLHQLLWKEGYHTWAGSARQVLETACAWATPKGKKTKNKEKKETELLPQTINHKIKINIVKINCYPWCMHMLTTGILFFPGQEGLYRKESEEAAEGWGYVSSSCHGQSWQFHIDGSDQGDVGKVGQQWWLGTLCSQICYNWLEFPHKTPDLSQKLIMYAFTTSLAKADAKLWYCFFWHFQFWYSAFLWLWSEWPQFIFSVF